MLYGRVKGGRVWHLMSEHRIVTMCDWASDVVEVWDLPRGRLCVKCYAIREELNA